MHKILLGLLFLCLQSVSGLAQANCPSSQVLRYEDGSTGCMTDNKFFSIKRSLSNGQASIIDTIGGQGMYLVAMTKNPKICPINFMQVSSGGSRMGQAGLLNRCEDGIAERAARRNLSPAGCNCEIIYDSTRAKNITLSKAEFELKTRAWMATAQNSDQFKDQFTEEEKKANTIFLAEYMKQADGLPSASLASSQSADKKLQEEQLKKQQLEQQEKELAEKARIEKEKSLAEEKRIAQEIASKGQLDKDAANKARIEKEKSLAEEKRIAQELAKVQALEKEKTDLIAKLQQEKDAREKAVATKVVSDEARILALRKELEKEIRASIQTESAGKASIAPPTVYANRKALVIGNDSYQKVTPLANAREDAKVLAESLTALGYKVSLKLDVTEKQFKSEIRTFKSQVQPGDEVAIFYAGHGVQINSTNFLLPIDIGGQNEEEVKDEAISLQRLLDDMNEKGAKFTLAMIDACRDNPFKVAGRSIAGGRGLAPTTAATGQMIVFSAGSGQQALDKLGPADKSKNGLFTRVFVKEMQKAGISVDRVVRNVRSEVVSLAKSVGHDQVPAIYDQVVGEFYFKK
jgi:hypothetical protein